MQTISRRMSSVFALLLMLFYRNLPNVDSLARYYGAYLPMGTGDTIIETIHMHGGATDPLRKWNVECLDGEALIGVRDMQDDFQRINALWCKYMFPFKPPSQGLYPYYPNCFARNLSRQNFCFEPREGRSMLNSFVSGIYDNDVTFGISRLGPPDETTLYKCCRTPPGYYIDYMSCYYKMTHDQYHEYYNAWFFLVFCDTGFVVTGLARKINPYINEYNLDWIQCCRVGVGPGVWPILGPSHLLHGISRSYSRTKNGPVSGYGPNSFSDGHIINVH